MAENSKGLVGHFEDAIPGLFRQESAWLTKVVAGLERRELDEAALGGTQRDLSPAATHATDHVGALAPHGVKLGARRLEGCRQVRALMMTHTRTRSLVLIWIGCALYWKGRR